MLTATYAQLENFLDGSADALPDGVYTFTFAAAITGGPSTTGTFTWTLTDPCLAPSAIPPTN